MVNEPILKGINFQTISSPSLSGFSFNILNGSISCAGINFQTEITTLTGSMVKYFDGSTWTEKPLKMWDGDEWVLVKLKYHNGQSWIEK